MHGQLAFLKSDGRHLGTYLLSSVFVVFFFFRGSIQTIDSFNFVKVAGVLL